MGDVCRIVFSDIDGTIMHDPNENTKDNSKVILVTPPSTSGRQGAISAETIHKVATLRARGLKFVIITGARLSTLLMRLPYLPLADAYVCEGGGRIFYPGSSLPVACPVSEDDEWRSLQAAQAGDPGQDAIKPEERIGNLWDLYRALGKEGYKLDANGYTTSFRTHPGSKTMEELIQISRSCPPGICSSFNIGAADFYPVTSGKVEAAKYLMSKWGSDPSQCTFLCDDDNDIQLALAVRKAFLPNITSPSLQQIVDAHPEKFVLATKKHCEATEEMIEAVLKHYGI
jgi:hydroxymethylpyrimidine pyrophosphatase-like HAD family hydrolase